ncbi:unnamed protein product, partial [Staurois parvus]
MYTDHQSIDDQCALMIYVASAAPPVSVHQCQLSMLIHATCQCPSVPHQSQCPISESFLSVPPISASQCHLTVPYECCLSVPISDASQCPSVPPTCASSSVPPISVHQCSLISAHQ